MKNPKSYQNMPDDQRNRFLISFLMVLVERNGGVLKIDNLSEFGGRKVCLNMDMNGDSVILRTTEIKLNG